MSLHRHLFTSESVTEGHPDKICDQISDAILDAILARDPYGRVAVETFIHTGCVHVAGQISTECYVDIPRIVRQTITDIGYTRAKFGFDADTCGIIPTVIQPLQAVHQHGLCPPKPGIADNPTHAKSQHFYSEYFS